MKSVGRFLRWLRHGGYPCPRCLRYANSVTGRPELAAGDRQMATLLHFHVQVAHGRRGEKTFLRDVREAGVKNG